MSRDETLQIMPEDTSQIKKHFYVFMYIPQIVNWISTLRVYYMNYCKMMISILFME